MIFVDSDVILDTVLRRYPYVRFSDELFANSYRLKLCTSTHCLLNVYYFGRKSFGNEATKQIIINLLKKIKVLSVDAFQFNNALESEMTDFEDAVQHAVALSNHCDTIITRNLKHYKHAELPVLTAEQYLNTL